MPSFIDQLTTRVPALAGEHFAPAPTGTRHDVWLSGTFVIRSQKQPTTVQREAGWLERLSPPLAPQVVWSDIIDEREIMVEKRLAGAPADEAWPHLTAPQQLSITSAFTDWLSDLRQHTAPHHSAVQLAEDQASWQDLLQALYQPSWQTIQENKLPEPAQKLWTEATPLLQRLRTLSPPSPPSLVHGDPIMHNVLVDDARLSGVIDWEFSLFGDPYYDYARLLYYRDCALAYGSPSTSYHGCETAFYQAVWDRLQEQPWFDQAYFGQAFPLYRATFYTRSLAWALTSSNPAQNSAELYESWQKKEGVQR